MRANVGRCAKTWNNVARYEKGPRKRASVWICTGISRLLGYCFARVDSRKQKTDPR